MLNGVVLLLGFVWVCFSSLCCSCVFFSSSGSSSSGFPSGSFGFGLFGSLPGVESSISVSGVFPGELQLFMKGIGIHGSENDGRLNFGNEKETSGIGGRSHNMIPAPMAPHTLHPTRTGTIVVCPLLSVVVSHVLECQSALLLTCA